MLLSIIRLYPAPENEHAVIDVLNSLKGPISALTDCVDCLILSEANEHASVCYLEMWKTREALNEHLQSTLYGRVLEAVELSKSNPIVEFYEVERIGGLEYIEFVRTPQR